VETLNTNATNLLWIKQKVPVIVNLFQLSLPFSNLLLEELLSNKCGNKTVNLRHKCNQFLKISHRLSTKQKQYLEFFFLTLWQATFLNFLMSKILYCKSKLKPFNTDALSWVATLAYWAEQNTFQHKPRNHPFPSQTHLLSAANNTK
jgi:hypothetical protein